MIELMQSDPSLRLLTDPELEEAIRLWDEMFDDRQHQLTADQTGAVRHVLAVLNGEKAERKNRQESRTIHAVSPAPKQKNHRQDRDSWIKRLLK